MTTKTLNQVKEALASAHPCNTSNDYSLSIHLRSWGDKEHHSVTVYPSGSFPFFTEMQVLPLLALTKVFDCRVTFKAKNGVVVCDID